MVRGHSLHPKYSPSEEEKGNARLFADNVRHYISEHLKVPEVDLGREDGWCLLAAEKAGLPDHAGLGMIIQHMTQKQFNVIGSVRYSKM